MDPFTMVVLIVLISTIGVVWIIRAAIAARRGGRGLSQQDAERLVAEVRELKARVVVLERALTDTARGIDLVSEIDRLR